MGTFKRATKTESKLRLALAGPSGSGKTYTALTLATALADGKPVAVVDTERGSASKYADEFAFDVLELVNFHPNNYVEAVLDAARSGYAVVVVDSLSHAWEGTGGLLEIVGGNFTKWKEVKPIENKLFDTLISAPIHVIATMRTKSEYVMQEVEKNGRKTTEPQKVGTAPRQRDGIEYEFDVYGEMDLQNTLSVRKSRCRALSGAVISRPGPALAETLRGWLAGAPAEASKPIAVTRDDVAQLANRLHLGAAERKALFAEHDGDLEAIHRALAARAAAAPAVATDETEPAIEHDLQRDTDAKVLVP